MLTPTEIAMFNRIVLMFALTLASAAHASEAPGSKALSSTQAFIENNTLTASSERAVFRLDFATGRVSIIYATSPTYEDYVSPLKSTDVEILRKAGFIWVNAYGAKALGNKSVADGCGAETNALMAAIENVTAACDSGDAQLCASALNHAGRAFAIWMGCMQAHFQQMN